MSRRTRAPRGEAAPAKPGARDATTINSIKFSELTVGLEVEGEKFPGVATIKSIEQMKDRTDDNGDQVVCLYLKRPVGRMPMDPYYIMSYDKFLYEAVRLHTKAGSLVGAGFTHARCGRARCVATNVSEKGLKQKRR